MADMSSPLSTTATATSTIYLSVSGSKTGTATSSAFPATTTPAQGSLDSAGAGITGGYTGDSLPLKIIIAFLLGLALYNAIELIVLAFVTFQRYRGLYFWSLVVSAFGIIPYSLGFIIKFFRLLDPNENVGYVAVVLLTLGWWSMVSGQSVVLWSRLHLLTNSRRVLRWTLYMIICNGIVLHSVTTVLTFGSNSNSLTRPTLQRFVRGYSIMEKTQMVGFFVQETILSIIYIKETIRLLKLSEAVQDDARSFDNTTTTNYNNMGSVGSGSGGGAINPHLKQASVRKTMYQLLAINVLIITMDLALLAVEFANLYLIETTLKGVVYSIKLKLEFAVLGKLIQLVRDRAESDHSLNPASAHLYNGNGYVGGSNSGGGAGNTLALEKTASSSDYHHHHHNNNGSTNTNANANTNANMASGRLLLNGNPLTHDFVSGTQYPDFVDPRRLSSSVTHAAEHHRQVHVSPGWETRGRVGDGCGGSGGGGMGGGFGEGGTGQERWRRRSRVKRGSWIDEEMDKFNIG